MCIRCNNIDTHKIEFFRCVCVALFNVNSNYFGAEGSVLP